MRISEVDALSRVLVGKGVSIDIVAESLGPLRTDTEHKIDVSRTYSRFDTLGLEAQRPPPEEEEDVRSEDDAVAVKKRSMADRGESTRGRGPMASRSDPCPRSRATPTRVFLSLRGKVLENPSADGSRSSNESYRANESEPNIQIGEVMSLEKILYTAKAHTTGGRDGASTTSDGRLDIKLSSPGGPGNGTNPEQLFAAGWSACFIGALGVAAREAKVKLPAETAIDAEIDLGTVGTGYELQARLDVSLPGLAREVAQSLVDAAHRICPYSKATRGNIPVTVRVV